MACAETGKTLVDRLLGSYQVEAGLYHSLLAIAQEQGALLETGGDLERCTALFERKDELLRTLACIEREMEPLKRQWWSESVAPAGRERLNTLLDGILITIEALMTQEQRNEQLLLESHRAVEAELGLLHRGAEMHRLHDEAAQPEPRFMDTRR